jgi:hypothetical protein
LSLQVSRADIVKFIHRKKAKEEKSQVYIANSLSWFLERVARFPVVGKALIIHPCEHLGTEPEQLSGAEQPGSSGPQQLHGVAIKPNPLFLTDQGANDTAPNEIEPPVATPIKAHFPEAYPPLSPEGIAHLPPLPPHNNLPPLSATLPSHSFGNRVAPIPFGATAGPGQNASDIIEGPGPEARHVASPPRSSASLTRGAGLG